MTLQEPVWLTIPKVTLVGDNATVLYVILCQASKLAPLPAALSLCPTREGSLEAQGPVSECSFPDLPVTRAAWSFSESQTPLHLLHATE